ECRHQLDMVVGWMTSDSCFRFALCLSTMRARQRGECSIFRAQRMAARREGDQEHDDRAKGESAEHPRGAPARLKSRRRLFLAPSSQESEEDAARRGCSGKLQIEVKLVLDQQRRYTREYPDLQCIEFGLPNHPHPREHPQ